MRGRKPRNVQLKQEDIPQLEALIRSGKTEQRVARRARILLGIHRGERVKELCNRVEGHRSAIWRVCRRYEERGMNAVYDAPRSGRPPEISPPGAGADRKPGLHQTDRPRVERDALVGAHVAHHGNTPVDRARNPLYDHRRDSAYGDIAASSLEILENHCVGQCGHSASSQGVVVL